MNRNLSGNQIAKKKKYWFVVHTHKLWNVNNKILGFWNQSQWSQISVGDYIIYYRSQCNNQIKGLFEITNKAEDIDINFSKQYVQRQNPVYQLSLIDLNKTPKIKRIINVQNLSFYAQWVASKYGRYNQQVFKAKRRDINLIF